jgi:hypothetical protein
MWETIKLIILVILGCGLIGAIGIAVSLWSNILATKKYCDEAEADGVLTDDEYVKIGRETVAIYRNAKTLWAFLKNLAISIAGTLNRARSVRAASCYKLPSQK